jgi:hypothetical protein
MVACSFSNIPKWNAIDQGVDRTIYDGQYDVIDFILPLYAPDSCLLGLIPVAAIPWAARVSLDAARFSAGVPTMSHSRSSPGRCAVSV